MTRVPIIIIGAGLTGLTVAHRLNQAGIRALILEARPRPGGRIHTHYAAGKAPVEMGATWLGVKHRHLVGLLRELKLELFRQELGNVAMYDHGPGREPEQIPFPPGQEPSYRIAGGSSAMIRALVDKLAPEQILFGHPVESLVFDDTGGHLKTPTAAFRAARVVSTLPPNLLVSRVRLSPAPPAALTALARQTHTWMGESIKAGMRFPSPFWRSGKRSGTLFSNAGPLTEAYEHADYEDHHFAIKGFLAPGLTHESATNRQRLVRDQLRRIYGEEALLGGEYLEYPWAEDPFTYAPYARPVGPHQHNGHPSLREPIFDGRLLLAGSETAGAFPGYMDGAVESAEFTAKRLLDTQ